MMDTQCLGDRSKSILGWGRGRCSRNENASRVEWRRSIDSLTVLLEGRETEISFT